MAEQNPSVVSCDTQMKEAQPRRDNNPNERHVFTDENPAAKVDEWTMLVKLHDSGNNAVDIVTIHRAIISKMRHTDPTVSFTTSDSAVITTDEDFPTGYEYKTKFKMKESKSQFTVAHKIFSTMPLEEIKRSNSDLLDYLNSHNVFLDISASGSITEVLLGPFFGIHPDHTNKRQLEKDIYKLITVHQTWDANLTKLHDEAKRAHPFDSVYPAFQLRSRRLKRNIQDTDYTAKAVVFICAGKRYWFRQAPTDG
jgi:hypothetical protein